MLLIVDELRGPCGNPELTACLSVRTVPCGIRNDGSKNWAAQEIQDPVQHAFNIGRHHIAALTQRPHDSISRPDHCHEQTAADVEHPDLLAFG